MFCAKHRILRVQLPPCSLETDQRNFSLFAKLKIHLKLRFTDMKNIKTLWWCGLTKYQKDSFKGALTNKKNWLNRGSQMTIMKKIVSFPAHFCVGQYSFTHYPFQTHFVYIYIYIQSQLKLCLLTLTKSSRLGACRIHRLLLCREVKTRPQGVSCIWH